MKKHLLTFSVFGLMAVGCQAAPTNSLKWPAHSDGFASVTALEQNGTTGGAGGKVVTVDNLADLEKYAGAAEPLVILVKGTIVKEPFGKAIKVTSNKTILGLGDDATLLHGELQVQDASNIIFRNLTIKDSWMPDDPNGKKFDFDGIQIDRSHHIWIDHCKITHMEDGLIDFRKNSDYLTVSWSILSNHNKAFGIGWTQELGHMHVTMHHTWIQDTNQRNPSLDNGTGHLYNNYLQNISSYGNYSRGKSKVVVENSIFEKVNRPLVCDTDAEMVERGNILQDCSNVEEEKAKIKGTAFNPRDFYAYQLDNAKDIPEILQKKAGPQATIGTPEMGEMMANPTAQAAQLAANSEAQMATDLQKAAEPVAVNPSLALKKGIVVAEDGSGDFKTIQEAIAAIPDNSAEPVVVRIKPGTYHGQIILPVGKNNVHFVGDDTKTTFLTFAINTNEEQPAGIDPRHKGIGVVILGDDFQASNLTFQNTSGDHGQALALRIVGDRAIVKNCRLLGWQDTLRVDKKRQYFRDCYIEGRVDFIYGSGTAIFDNCEIKSKNGGYVTAANTPQEVPFGFVFLNCKLTASPEPWVDPTTVQPPAGRRSDAAAFLGRPWREYASVTYINCQMGSHIRPEGWNNWGKVESEKTARYAEFGSRQLDIVGPDGKIVRGAPLDLSKRVSWAKVLTEEEAAKYTIEGIFGNWNPNPRPTFVLVGDSTVTDDAGWGAGFKALLKPNISLVNLAKGGRSSASFVNEGSWQKALDLKPQYVLVQFGHNDQPGHGPERESIPETTYKANMARYVDEARAAGITPILVTPLTRREWKGGHKIQSSLAPYAVAVRELGKDKKVPVIDLQARSIEFFEKLGPEKTNALSPTKEGGKFDGTHLNEAGSAAIAPLVVAELEKVLPALSVDFKQ